MNWVRWAVLDLIFIVGLSIVGYTRGVANHKNIETEVYNSYYKEEELKKQGYKKAWRSQCFDKVDIWIMGEKTTLTSEDLKSSKRFKQIQLIERDESIILYFVGGNIEINNKNGVLVMEGDVYIKNKECVAFLRPFRRPLLPRNS